MNIISDACKYFSFPKKCVVNKKIFKKTFYDNADIAKTAHKLIRDEVEDMFWLYNLTPKTINVSSYTDDEYQYQEIQIISAKLKSQKTANKILSVLQGAMPYPVVIIAESNGLISLNTALKRKSKAGEDKLTVENTYCTDWLNINALSSNQEKFLRSLSTKGLSFINLYELYADIARRVRLLALCEYKSEYAILGKKQSETAFKAYDKIKEMETELVSLRRKIKDVSFADQVKLNVEIKRLGKTIKTYKRRLDS